MANAFEYYSNDSAHGGYQYVPLSEVIDMVLLESQDDDSFLKNTKRSQIIHHAKHGVKELNKSAANDILAMEITIGDDLSMVLPQDYVNYVRISLVTDDNVLVPLNVNRNINIAEAYLQDHKYELLFDSDCNVLTAQTSSVPTSPFKIYEFDCGGGSGHFLTDTSKISQFGEFNIDERRGKIQFSSNLKGRDIVLEYVSDGLQWSTIDEGSITIHKYLVETLRAWIIWKCVQNRRTVPRNYVHEKRLEYKSFLHQSKLDRSDIKLLEVVKEMRSKHKWL